MSFNSDIIVPIITNSILKAYSANKVRALICKLTETLLCQSIIDYYEGDGLVSVTILYQPNMSVNIIMLVNVYYACKHIFCMSNIFVSVDALSPS